MVLGYLNFNYLALSLLAVMAFNCVKKQGNDKSNTPPPAGDGSTGGALGGGTTSQSAKNELEKFRLSLVDKPWKVCFISDNTSTQIDLVFKADRKWTTASRNFTNKACEGKALSLESEEGSYTIENSRTSGVFPINLTRTTSTPFYEIASLRGDKLYFGKTDDIFDTSTPEKRPKNIDTSSYYMATPQPPILKMDFHN